MLFAIELFKLIIVLSLFHVITFWLAFLELAMNTQRTPSEQAVLAGRQQRRSCPQVRNTAQPTLLRPLDTAQKADRVNSQRNPNT